MTDFRVVQERAEYTVVPEGISITETLISYYIRIRTKGQIVAVKIDKETEEIVSASQEIETSVDRGWFGVWGTKG